jgi:signal transduction histidine kinase
VTDHPVPEFRHRGLSLKGVLLVLLSAVTIYTTAMMVFLTLQLGRIAADMRQSDMPERFLYEEVTTRVHVLTGASVSIHQMMHAGEPVDSVAVAAMRGDLTEYIDSHRFPPLEQIPSEAREPVMLAQADANRMQSIMFEVLDLVVLGQLEAVSERIEQMDSLRMVFDARLTRAQLESISDLHARRTTLADTSREALTALGVWLVVGLIGLPVIWIIARQRIWQPLSRLEEGLARVAQGDLRVQVSVRRFDEVGRLASHFNSMTGILRQRAEEQGRFAAAGQLIAGVAHEVNNPLMAIAAMGETRLEDPGLPTEQRAELRHIVRQARRAGRLLSGLLRFVRADSSGLESADLNGVCRDAVDLVSYRFGHEDIALDTRYAVDLPSAEGNPARIEQVVVNLISNALDALQFVDSPRQITMTTYALDGRVCLAVEDNGPGIPEEVQPRLFHPFASTKGNKGTGLGLYISRQIVRDLDGDLIFEQVGHGARFVVSLPVSAEAVQHPVAQSPPQPLPRVATLTGLRVLVVDDEDGIRIPLAKFLTRRGADAIQAADGVEALDKLEHHQVDAILADLKMPRMDGVALYRALQETRPDLANRVIFLTGDLAQMEEGSEADFDPGRVLIKPVKLADVEQRLQQVCSEPPADAPT